MIERLHLAPIVFLVGLLWLGLLLLNGVAVELRWLSPFSMVLSSLLVVLGAFDKWLWKLPWLNGWFANRPVLCGTWEARLESEWVEPRTGVKPGTVTCYMAVRQNFSTLSLRLLTPESSSSLLAGEIKVAQDGVFQVAGVYMNKPDLHLRGYRSEIHYGALLLDVHGAPPQELRGHYWTDRLTRGSMTLVNRRSEVYETFDRARAAFEQPTPSVAPQAEASK